MATADGEPFFADPRQVLRNAAQTAAGAGAHRRRRDRARVLSARSRTASSPRRRSGAFRARASAQDGPQYGSMEDVEDVDPFLAELYAVCAAQNIPVGATLKEFSPGQFEVNLHHVANAELRLRSRRAAETRGEGRRAAPWHGRELHGEAVRGVRGLQPARAREPHGRRQAATCSPARRGQPFSDTFRHAVGGLAATMARIHGDLRAHGEFLSPLPAGAVRAARAELGPQPSRRRAARAALRRAKTRASSIGPGGADGNPYLVMAAILAGIHHGITNRCDPGPMVQPGDVIEEKISLPLRWEAALDAFDAGTVLPQYLGKRYHKLYGDLPTRRMRSVPC